MTTTVGKAIPQRSIINTVSNTTFVILCYGHYVVEFGTMLNMDLWTLTIHAVVVTVMFHVLAVQHWFLIFLIAFFNSFLVRQPTVLLSFLMKRYKMDINRVDPSTLEHLNTWTLSNMPISWIKKSSNSQIILTKFCTFLTTYTYLSSCYYEGIILLLKGKICRSLAFALICTLVPDFSGATFSRVEKYKASWKWAFYLIQGQRTIISANLPRYTDKWISSL